MDKRTFETINNLWFNTDLGRYIKYGSMNDEENGRLLIEKLFKISPDWAGILRKQEKEIANKIKSIINQNEYENYLHSLDSVYPDMLSFMITHDFLIEI